MSPPHLPNELVTLIFEHLYRSLCVHPSEDFLDFPISDKFIFSRFSLVSKTWHALSLPFLVRHCDGHRLEEYKDFVKKYDLAKKVESIHFNMKIPKWDDYKESAEALMEDQRRDYGYGHRYGYEYDDISDDDPDLRQDCLDEAFTDMYSFHDEDRDKEKARWSYILQHCMATVKMVEFGPRPRKKLETSWPDENWREMMESGEADPMYGPGRDVIDFMDGLRGPKVKQLRINLLAGANINWLDQAHSDAFPQVKDLTIASYSASFEIDDHSVEWKDLCRLRILNLYCLPDQFQNCLIPSYLKPSAGTLTHLQLSLHPNALRQRSTVLYRPPSCFDSLVFPRLKHLDLDIPHLLCGDPELFDRFPVITTAAIPLYNSLTPHRFFTFPPHLTHLSLTHFDAATIPVLCDHLSDVNLGHLSRLQIQGFRFASAVQPVGGEQDPTKLAELEEARGIGRLVKVCKRRGVEVLFEDLDIERESWMDEIGADEEDQEDEAWDFDAEDGEEFKEFWSSHKRRDHDLGTHAFCLT